MIFPLEEEDVVGDVRGETGFLVLNLLWYRIRTGRGGGEGDSCFMGVGGRPYGPRDLRRHKCSS